jgi:hypothetical protein
MNSPSQLSQMRRYDLPTCLLEVWSERSPLSEWADRPVAKNLRFRLQIEQQKIMKGNQNQIAKLIEATIVQVDRLLASDHLPDLNHTLDVPNFQTFQLSTLQLFDLFTSLEQCADEIVILPCLELEVKRVTPAWLKIAAVAIASVGVTLGAIRFVMPQSPVLQVATSASPIPSAGSAPGNLSKADADTSKSGVKQEKAPNENVAIVPIQPSIQSSTPPASVQPKGGVPSPSVGSTRPSTQSPGRDRQRRAEIDNVAVAPRVSAPSVSNPTSGAFGNLPAPIPPTTKPVQPNLEPNPNIDTKLESRSQPIKPSAPARIPAQTGGEPAGERKPDELDYGLTAPSTAAVPQDALPYIRQGGRPMIKVVSVDAEGGDGSNVYVTSLSQYLQTVNLPQSSRGNLEVELVLRDRRVGSVVITAQDSGFRDSKDDSVDRIKRSLLNWTPPLTLQQVQPNTFVKLRLVLQIQ